MTTTKKRTTTKKPAKKTTNGAGQWVLVTTVHRGVFWGRLLELSDTVRLAEARNCLYWSTTVRGFLGLATTGPDKTCRIGPAVPELALPRADVTSVAVGNEAAAEAWRAAPWA